MPVKYLSPEWIDAYNATVAADESVRTAMKGRNAVIQMLIAQGPDGEIHYWLRIGDGSVSAALGDADNAEVTISQSYDTAAKVNSGELDLGSKAFTQGKVKIKGKMMKMMQLRGPLAELEKALDTIETEYEPLSCSSRRRSADRPPGGAGFRQLDAGVERVAAEQLGVPSVRLVGGDLGVEDVLGLGARPPAGVVAPSTAAKISAISSSSSGPNPSVVSAGVPIRIPEVYQAPLASLGMLFLLVTTPAFSRADSAWRPVSPKPGGHVRQHQVVAGAAGHQPDAAAQQPIGQRLGVVDDRGRIAGERGLAGLGERDRLGRHHVRQRAAEDHRPALVDERPRIRRCRARTRRAGRGATCGWWT